MRHFYVELSASRNKFDSTVSFSNSVKTVLCSVDQRDNDCIEQNADNFGPLWLWCWSRFDHFISTVL